MVTGEKEIQFFEALLFESLGQDHKIKEYQFLNGGSINTAIKLTTSGGNFFLKWNEQDLEDMFKKEAKGLELLRSSKAGKIPEVIGFGTCYGNSYLLLEYLDDYPQTADYWKNLGVALAQMHTNTHTLYGLDYDNYIGSLEQYNDWKEDGIEFYAEKRIKAQAGLAYYNNFISHTLFEKINHFCDNLADFIPHEKPALLHGDLWIGNTFAGKGDLAVLIDPAVYYGLREAELAFTKLFGGFDALFYKAYNEVNPLEPGFEERYRIYNLYPLLVHVNLFGSSYVSGVEKIIKKFYK